MNRKILVVDTHSILHTVKHSMSKSALSNREGPTFIIYGFLLKLHSILSQHYFDVIAYTFDDKHSFRKELYAEYKENRSDSNKNDKDKKLDAIARPQFDIVKYEILPKLGYRNRFQFKGLEADDIIAKICKTYKSDEITILSNDGDLYQLLNNNVVILNPRSMRFFNAFDFIEKYGIEPKMWKRVKVYGGCSTDNVPGLPIPGSTKKIGEGYALQYVKGELPIHYKAYQAFVVPSAKKLIIRNKKLVLLPHKKTPDVKILPDNKLSANGLKEIIKKYSFKSIQADFKSYCKVLRLRSF